MQYDANRHNYLNKSFDFIISANIKEYDIKSAGLNMLISAKAIPQDTIDYLSSLPKQERTIKEGLMQKKNKELTKVINNELIKYRRLFIKENNLEDHNIISVKRDAIFVVNSSIKKTKFNNVEFRPKNTYSSYYNINKVEYYYSKFNDVLHLKGLSDSKELSKHNKYMFAFLKEIFKLNEVSKDSACKYLKKFANDYRKLNLPEGYYRELNSDSLYRLKDLQIGSMDLAVDIPTDINDIDIRYNYINIILSLVKMIY